MATVRALKLHGGAPPKELSRPDPERVQAGLPNLEKHIENIHEFGENPVVALNHFGDDTDEEVAIIQRRCAELGVPFALSQHHARGGEGAAELARMVVKHAEHGSPYHPLYSLEDPFKEKVTAVAQKM